MIQPTTTLAERQAVLQAIQDRPADETIHEGHGLEAELLARLVRDAGLLEWAAATEAAECADCNSPGFWEENMNDELRGIADELRRFAGGSTWEHEDGTPLDLRGIADRLEAENTSMGWQINPERMGR